MTYTFKKREIAATLKIYINVDSAGWNQLYDISTPYKDMTFSDLYNNEGATTNHLLKFDLANYVGKKVQIAYEYVGQDGNGLCIDAFKVGTPATTASYERPRGAFYFGFSKGYKFLQSSGKGFMLTPAYSDQTWVNTSSPEADSFKWAYTNASGESVTATDNDLTVNYPFNYKKTYNWYSVPALSAIAAGVDDKTYSWNGAAYQVGGKAQYTYTDGSVIDFDAGNYDVINNKFYDLSSNAGPLFGYYPNIDDTWTSIFGTSSHLKSISNFFEAPTHTYALSRVTVLGTGTIAPDAELNLTVRAVDGYGYLADTLAVASCKGSDIVKTIVEGSTDYLAIPFKLKSLDKDSNLVETTIGVESPIFVTLEGFDNAKVTTFGAFQSGADPAQETNGYFTIETHPTDTTTSNSLYELSSLRTSSGPCYSSFLFNIDANYSWIECAEDEFKASNDGESKTFTTQSSTAPENFKFEFDSTEVQPDWLVVGTDGLRSAGELTFTVAPLPSSIRGRSCVVRVYSECSYKDFTIVQGDITGVNTVRQDSKVKVNVSNGNFNVFVPANVSSVNVFNTAGQIVKIAKFNGSTQIDAQDLSKGIYLLKFNDGEVVKVIK